MIIWRGMFLSMFLSIFEGYTVVLAMQLYQTHPILAWFMGVGIVIFAWTDGHFRWSVKKEKVV